MAEVFRRENDQLTEDLVAQVVGWTYTPSHRLRLWFHRRGERFHRRAPRLAPSNAASQDTAERRRLVHFELTGMGLVPHALEERRLVQP